MKKYPLFHIASEHVRGEPRFYWVERQAQLGAPWAVMAGTNTTRKAKAQRECKLCADASNGTVEGLP